MIRSQFDLYQFIGQFVMTALLAILVYLFYLAWFGPHPVNILSGLGVLFVLVVVVLPAYIVAQMKVNYKRTVINTTDQTISFKMFLLPITKTYPLNYFDGYIETKVSDKYSQYKCLYLVKDGKLKYKMSGRFYNNIDELQQGLAGLKNLGNIEFSTNLSIKIALGKPVLA